MTTNTGGPAPTYFTDKHAQSMTLRDYFAAKAMQGMLSDLPETLYGTGWQVNVANSSYSVADAMLKARVL